MIGAGLHLTYLTRCARRVTVASPRTGGVMAYLCIVGLFLLTAFVWICWMLGHLGDVMTGVDIEER